MVPQNVARISGMALVANFMIPLECQPEKICVKSKEPPPFREKQKQNKNYVPTDEAIRWVMPQPQIKE